MARESLVPVERLTLTGVHHAWLSGVQVCRGSWSVDPTGSGMEVVVLVRPD